MNPLHLFRFSSASAMSMLFLAYVTLLSGCASLQQLSEAQKPSAKVTSVAIADLSLSSITLNAKVNIHNPNPFELKTAGMELEAAIAGHALAHISQPDSQLTLPASGDKTIDVPVTIKFSELFAAAKSVKGKNQVPYGLSGEILVAVPVLGTISMPLEYQDVLPIPQLPDIRIDDVKLLKAGFTEVKLQLDMTIKNLNDFAIDLQQLNFNLAAQGQSLGGGELNSVSLDSGKSQSVSLPLSLSLSEFGSALLRLINSDKPMDFSLDGNARVIPGLDAWQADTMSFNVEKQLSL